MRLEHSVIGFHCDDVLRQLTPVRISIRECAIETELLIGPEYETNRSLWLDPKLLDESQRLPCSNTAACIIHRACPYIPRIEMTTDDDDLIRLFGSANFRDHIA